MIVAATSDCFHQNIGFKLFTNAGLGGGMGEVSNVVTTQ